MSLKGFFDYILRKMLLTTKLYRQSAEIVSIRTEVASITARGEILTMDPIRTIEDLKSFEETLKQENTFKIFVSSFCYNNHHIKIHLHNYIYFTGNRTKLFGGKGV